MISRLAASSQTGLVKTARWLAAVWVSLSLADAIVTYFCLQNAANIEGNPLARVLLTQHEALFYGAKGLITVGIGVGFWWLSTRTRYLKPMIACQALLVVLFACVVGNNMLHL
jgi:hypothetical protein